MREDFDSFFFNVTPPELWEKTRAALLALADRLFEVARVFRGEVGTEARQVWLCAMRLGEPGIGESGEVLGLLSEIASIEAFVDNWSDCAKQGSPDKDEEWDLINAAGRDARAALLAVHALVDHVRAAAKDRGL